MAWPGACFLSEVIRLVILTGDDELPPLGGHVTLSNYHKWQMAFYVCKRHNE